MKCPLCSNEITPEASLIGPYKIFQPSIHNKDEGGEITVCGRCFLLTSINDTLQKLLEVMK